MVEVGPRGPRGVPQLVPGIADPHTISYAVGARELAWAKLTARQNIWSFPLGRSASISVRDGDRITSENEESQVADESPAGGAEPLLDPQGWSQNPAWSPDGREIAFHGGPRPPLYVAIPEYESNIWVAKLKY